LVTPSRPLAVVTGASSGIGRELARCCAEHGYDLVIAADQPEIAETANELRALEVAVDSVETDLATDVGVGELMQAIGNRPVDALLANAGHGLGKAFLEQDFAEVRHVIETNVTGTIDLVQRLARQMVARRQGRILITGSIAGFMPGSFQAVYNGTKAFIDSFSFALRNEIKDSGVTVTCFMPGATDTQFFERADMLDTALGQAKKDSPADVAKVGFEAMLKGEGDVVSGWKNKLQAAVANVTPSSVLAEIHRKQAEPGSGKKKATQK
jgi:short-subunit dehydrogenase